MNGVLTSVNITQDPMVFAARALVIVTFLLVIVTGFYMYFAGKMAKRMKKQVELQEREFRTRITPHLDLRLEYYSRSGPKISIRPRVFNGGLSPVFLDSVFLDFYHNEKPGQSNNELMAIKKHIPPGGGYYPEPTEYDYTKFPNFSGITDLKGKAHIEHFFKYDDLAGEKYRWPKIGCKVLRVPD